MRSRCGIARYNCDVVRSLRIALCGGLTVGRDGDRIEGELAGRQGREVFAYLVLNRKRPVSRDELAAMLWPEQAPRAPEAALNTILARLRRVLGHDALGARGQLMLALDAGSWIDVEVAQQGAETAAALLERGRARWRPIACRPGAGADRRSVAAGALAHVGARMAS